MAAAVGCGASAPWASYAVGGWGDFLSSAGEPAAEWGYQGEKGPAHWGELNAAFRQCSRGKAQSPVDIRNPLPVRMPPLSFHYRANRVSMVNTGNTVEVDYEPGSYILFGSHRYDLKQFHFHTPSEHTLYGERQDMEIHLVHEDRAGNVAIVAVFVRGGRRNNNVLFRLLERLPSGQGEHYYNREMGINATFLLPLRRDYLSYEGSLPIPPCSEGVRWLVLMNPVDVPRVYIQELHALMGNNSRPLQALNNRVLLLER